MKIEYIHLIGAILATIFGDTYGMNMSELKSLSAGQLMSVTRVWQSTPIEKKKKKLGVLHAQLTNQADSLSKLDLEQWRMQDIIDLTRTVAAMLGGIAGKEQERIRQALYYLKYAVKFGDDEVWLATLRSDGYTKKRESGEDCTVCYGTSATLAQLQKGWGLSAYGKARTIKKQLVKLVKKAGDVQGGTVIEVK
ncbi:MAG: hypothetical protein M1549_03270 [Candidatus Dependentiae bacterium]|nr:hypothetical protein [Candidatus Dependentiae bacterium]